MKPGWEAVIGLEVHVQLRTASKMFCPCANSYGEPPNSLTCPVCLGLPGALPVLNDRAVDLGIALGLAIHGHVTPRSTFYRKQYFYADLPKGYQITQGPVALVEDGWLAIPGDPAVRGEGGAIRVGILRAHLEEDAGKSAHGGEGGSLVDLNRAGVPLLEIVGAPDLRSGLEASEYLKTLHHLITYLGLCDGNMEEGSFRCDANVSVRPAGALAFGTRVEVKNLNSFRFVKQAIEFEIDRQIDLLIEGQFVACETRGWDAAQGRTRAQRGKEGDQDYRYMPEPDLPDLVVLESRVARVAAELPELPEARVARLRAAHGLTEYEAAMLLQTRAFGDFFEAAAGLCGMGKATANWMLGEVSRLMNVRSCSISELGLSPRHLADLVRLVSEGVVNLNTAREQVLPAVLAGEGDPAAVVSSRGLGQVSDAEALSCLVAEVLAAHPSQVAEVRGGQLRLRGFLVGQVMKAAGGKANPRLVNELLDAALAQR